METSESVRPAEPRRETTKHKASIGGSAIEALAGVTAVVLSIIGLAAHRNVVPFAAIAVIAAGVALLFEAGAVASYEASKVGFEGGTERAALKSGIGADAVAGIGAVTLGILSLIGLDPVTLLPVAAIVLGAGLLLSAAAPAAERNEEVGYGRREEILRESFAAASGVHVLVGAGSAVLGILGVLGNSPLLFTMIATLSIGAAQLLTGATVGARVANVIRHGAGA